MSANLSRDIILKMDLRDRVPSINALFNHALIEHRDIATVLATTPFGRNKEYALHSSGMYALDTITDAVDRMFPSEDQWVTRDGVAIYYCYLDKICTCNDFTCVCQHFSYADMDEETCKNITRGILWLLFHKHVDVTKNHLKHIRLKPLYQRLYEIDTQQHIIPTFVYRYMRVIEWVMNKMYVK